MPESRDGGVVGVRVFPDVLGRSSSFRAVRLFALSFALLDWKLHSLLCALRRRLTRLLNLVQNEQLFLVASRRIDDDYLIVPYTWRLTRIFGGRL
jgi:hypothetical protein